MEKSYHSRPILAPHTIFAVHLSGEDGWRVGTRPVTSDLLEQTLKVEGKNFDEIRIIFAHETHVGLGEHFILEHASGMGWLYDYIGETWRGPNEPITPPPALPEKGTLKLSIDELGYNKVWFSIFSGPSSVSIFGDECTCDPFPLLVRLVDRLKEGKEGHASSNDGRGNSYEMHIFNHTEENSIRIIVRVHDQEDKCTWIDFWTDRIQAYQALTNFLNDLSNHPDFVHQFLLSEMTDEEEWEKAYDLAEQMFAQAVASGELGKDDYDSKIALEHKVVREHVSIPEKEKPYVEKYLAMLRTLEVPETWFNWEKRLKNDS
mgnify:CR=1 FL=1